MLRPEIGVVLPTFPQFGGDGWTRIGRFAAEAESAGVDALWACDHVFWPTPVIDCFVGLSLAAAATSSIRIGTGVVQMPLRQTAVVAKQAGSLHLISGGRMILGVGVGQHEGEYAEADVAYGRRGRALDAAIGDLRRHWTATGGRYPMLPVAGDIPIWVGGSSDAARRRAARLGDAWMPLFVPPHKLAEQFALMEDEATAAGRPDHVTPTVMVFVSVGPKAAARERGLRWIGSLYGIAPERFSRHLVAGEAAECAEALASYAEAGARHLALFMADDDPLDQVAALMPEMAALARI